MELEKLILNELEKMNFGGAVVTHVSFMDSDTVINFDVGSVKIVFLIRDDFVVQSNAIMNTGESITDSEILRQCNEWAKYVCALSLPIIKKHRETTNNQETVIVPAFPIKQETVVPPKYTSEEYLHAQQLLHQQQVPVQKVQIRDEAQAKYGTLLDEMAAIKREVKVDESEPLSKKGKILSLIVNLLLCVCLTVTVALVALVVLFGFQEDETPPRNLFGYSVMTIVTDNMDPALPNRTLILSGPVEDDAIQISDDITFLRNRNSAGTQRVVDIYLNYLQTGRPGFRTQGIAGEDLDYEMVAAVNVIGRVVWSNYTMGQIIVWIQNQIILVGIVLVVANGSLILIKKFFIVPNRKS